jgi:hypothetical protein
MGLCPLRVDLDYPPELLGGGSPIPLFQHSHPLLEVQIHRLWRWLLSHRLPGEKESRVENQTAP